jgi:RNase P/RNase MRP subunit p29
MIVVPLLGGVAVAGAAPTRDAAVETQRVRPQEETDRPSDRPPADRIPTDRPLTDRRPDDRPDHDRARVAGLVVAEQGQTFELRTDRGAVIVHWTDATECSIDRSAVGCDAIDPGHALGALGAYAGDSNQFHAQVIRARMIGRPSYDRIAGVVVRDGDAALVVRTRDGEVTVLYDADTTCKTRDGEIRCADIELADAIVAAGQLSGSDLTARVIVLQPERPDRPPHDRLHGLVTAAHERLLQVETRDGSWNVHFDADTTCQLRDGSALDCGSIEARARILAGGVVTGDHNLEATVIVVLPQRAAATDEARTDVRPAS